MKLGLVLRVFNDVSFDDALREAAELGYEAVEIEVDAATGQLDIDEILQGNNAKRIRKKVADYGLSISAIGNHAEGQLVLGPHHSDTDIIFTGTPAEKIKYGIQRMKKTAQAAAALEVPVVTGFCGCEDYSRWYPWPDPNGWEKMAPAFVERWGEILDTFAEYRVKFAQECHPKQYAYNIETALETVELMNRPEWCFNLDPSNLMLADVDPVLFVQELRGRVVHVHAKDGERVSHNYRSGLLAHGRWNRIDRGFRHRIPGWGDVPWRKLITELSLVGYDYVLSVEHEDPVMDRRDGVMKAIKYLEPLLIERPATQGGTWW